MGQGLTRRWCGAGGIISLVRIIEYHERALNYDLMTRTGRTLDDYMNEGAVGKIALISFVQNLPIDSALYRDMNPSDEFGIWHTTAKTNAILADMYDAFVAVNTKKGRTPKPYPRPEEHRTIGKAAIPISEFWDWWYS